MYLAGLTLTKLSILLQYMRLFKEKVIHRFIIGMLVFVAAYGKYCSMPKHCIVIKTESAKTI